MAYIIYRELKVSISMVSPHIIILLFLCENNFLTLWNKLKRITKII